MKKLLLAVVLGLLLVAAFTTLALADNGPHGKFNGSTEACASCHRAHSAASDDGYLLVAQDVYGLCTSCHDGTGAITNVLDGYYEATTAGSHTAKAWKASLPTNQGEDGLGLFGGGFVNARMLTDYGNTATQTASTNSGVNANTSTTAWAVLNTFDPNQTAPVSRPVTSSHVVTGGAGTVWGSGATVAGGTLANHWNAGTLTLECTSCHDPHGSAGKQGGLTTGVPIPSYRLLRFTPEGSGGFEAATYVVANGFAQLYWDRPSTVGVSVPDVATKWYTPNTDYALDPSVAAYRGVNTNAGGTGNEMFVALIAGLGDYGGKYYAYRRPAATSSASTAGSGGRPISCPNGAPGVGVPTSPTTPCAAATGTAFNNLPAQDVLGFWCATCHDRYLAPGGSNGVPSAGAHGGSRDTDSNDPGYHFRHRAQGVTGTVTTAGVVTLGAYTGTGQYTCLSCHNAHGTAAQTTALSSSATYAGDSALLKADNRAICTRCHAAPVNFFNTVTTPGAIMIVAP
jgi:predicted CXXCH cytochrome family protein